MIGQGDGTPYGNLYPPAAWLPGQVVEDLRPLPATLALKSVATVRVGVYDPARGARLPAQAADGTPLTDGSFEIRP